jgi:hypothetical protein
VRRLSATLLVLACCSANGHGDPKPASDPETRKSPTATPKAAMDISYRDLPDDKWKHAADIVIAGFQEVLAKTNSVRVVIGPYTSPDGAIVPYLLFAESTDAAGSPAFRGSAAVWNDKLVWGGGPATATAILAAAGFPAKHIALGHLLEVLHLTKAIDLVWFFPPSAGGWDGITRPMMGTDLVRSLEYTQAGAVLRLYRPIQTPAGAGGGGITLPEYERLDVTFDAKAAFTQTVLRQNAAKTAWQPVR